MHNAMIIFPFFKKETISYGRAAEILNMRKIDLITIYGSLDIPYFDLSKEESEEDFKNIKTVMECV